MGNERTLMTHVLLLLLLLLIMMMIMMMIVIRMVKKVANWRTGSK